VKVDEPRDSGHTPLSLAARDGYLDVIKWWIASGREMDLDVPLLEILRQNEAQVRHELCDSGMLVVGDGTHLQWRLGDGGDNSGAKLWLQSLRRGLQLVSGSHSGEDDEVVHGREQAHKAMTGISSLGIRPIHLQMTVTQLLREGLVERLLPFPNRLRRCSPSWSLSRMDYFKPPIHDCIGCHILLHCQPAAPGAPNDAVLPSGWLIQGDNPGKRQREQPNQRQTQPGGGCPSGVKPGPKFDLVIFFFSFFLRINPSIFRDRRSKKSEEFWSFCPSFNPHPLPT